MIDSYWMLEAHRTDVEEQERRNRLRARWAEGLPVPPQPEYRRRLASLLLTVANWLDPRPARPRIPAWIDRAPSRNGSISVAVPRYWRT